MNRNVWKGDLLGIMVRNRILDNWECFLSQKNLDEEQIVPYLQYANTLLSGNLPVIFDVEHLSRILGCSVSYIEALAKSSVSQYQLIKRKKKGEGLAMGQVPSPILLDAQYWIRENILAGIRRSRYSYHIAGSEPKILKNEIYLSKPEILKIGIKDLFSSFCRKSVTELFVRLGYSEEVAFSLASVCCMNGSLPHSASTSSMLSNIITLDLDDKLFALAKKYGLKYGREDEGVIFSGAEIPILFIEKAFDAITGAGFKIKETKTQLNNRNRKRVAPKPKDGTRPFSDLSSGRVAG